MKYRASFLAEVERFDSCGRLPHHGDARTERGLEQFYAKESRGTEPENPDWYYTLLVNGKKWWEWTLNFYAERFANGDWPGWLQLAHDFKSDPAGFRQLRQRLRFEPANPEDVIAA